MAGGPNEIPLAAMSCASSITLAACSNAFEGMQPTFKHTPPNTGQRSISVTLRPRSAARNAAVYPPGPDPSTIRSRAPAGAVVALDTGAGAAAGAGAAGGVFACEGADSAGADDAPAAGAEAV